MQISCPQPQALLKQRPWCWGPPCFKPSPCMEKFKCTGTQCLKQRWAWPFLRCVEIDLLLMIVNTLTFMNNLYAYHLKRFFKIQISGSTWVWLSQNLHPGVVSRMYIIFKFLRGLLCSSRGGNHQSTRAIFPATYMHTYIYKQKNKQTNLWNVKGRFLREQVSLPSTNLVDSKILNV